MKKILLMILVAALGSGCKETPPPSSLDQLTGTLRGWVALYNETALYEHNKSGVLVECEGTPYSAITDSAGRWEIKNLPTRTYSISFSKPGYITWKNTSYVFIGGGIINFKGIDLYPATKYTPVLDAIILPHENILGGLYGHLTPVPPRDVFVQLFFLASHSPTMTIDDSTTYSTINGYNGHNLNWDSSGNFSLAMSSPGLNSGTPPPFETGATMYIRAYGYLYIGSYYDIKTDKQISSGYGPGSNVLSAVVE